MDLLSNLLSSDIATFATPQAAIILGIALGALMVVFGIATAFDKPDPALRRMRAQTERGAAGRADMGLLKGADMRPTGFMKSLVPADEKEIGKLRLVLARAGFNGARAVRTYFIVRATLGVMLPLLSFAAILAARSGALPMPDPVRLALTGLTDAQVMLTLITMIAGGFFGPALWVRQRAAERSQKIAQDFPNALDLLQISTEAGLGFDAALIRIGNELVQSAPEISEEFLLTEREINAGRARDRALSDMAARTGVDEVASFANAVNQSLRYGTSLAQTLATYAREMRLARELKAQEKANRLPVQMSAVMASLMLPALLLLTLGPVIIRYVDYMNR